MLTIVVGGVSEYVAEDCRQNLEIRMCLVIQMYCNPYFQQL